MTRYLPTKRPTLWGRPATSLGGGLAILAALALPACYASAEQGDLSIGITSGEGQVGLAGQPLPDPLVVRAEVDGEPLAGALLSWVVVEGGGSVYAGTSQTDDDGFAREHWTLGEVGPQRVEVRAVDPSTGERRLYASFEAEAVNQLPNPPIGDDDEEVWDFVLADTVVEGDVVVPDGEAWLIGPNVEVFGNVRTEGGTIAMRPGSSLRFRGADPEKYVGGGHGFSEELADDIGLWIGGHGVLDIRGTPKQGFNRTGVHPTWEPDDEYWISPTDVGDYEPRRWFPGDPIPQIDSLAPAAEVINVTRDIVIQGTGHIHIHSHLPQRIEYVQLRDMGVSSAAHEGEVLGRYALHLHHGEWGTEGTIIRGVAAIDSRGRVFVPHESHGIMMIDNVSVNSYAQALWWDKGELTHDLVVDGFAATGVKMPREIRRTGREVVTLGSGKNNTIRNAAVSGARGGRSIGFHWNTKRAHREETSAVWSFDEGNVAHNNEGFGIRFWFNDRFPHHVVNTVTYRNAQGGIENGAYGNAVRYADTLLIDEGFDPDAASHRPAVGVHHNSNSRLQRDDGEPARYENVRIVARDGVAFEVGNRNLAADSYLEIIDCELEPGPGQPKVFVQDGKNPWQAHFIRSGVTPEDFVFETLDGGNEGTHILIDHEDGRKWEILVEGGEKLVRER